MKEQKNIVSHYIDTLQSNGKYYFLREEVISSLDVSEVAFQLAIMRLIDKKRVVRVRSDFYVLVPLEYRETGCLPASWFIDDLMRYLKADYYVGILSAAALHGAAHQQPMTFQVICNEIIRPIYSDRLKIEFHFKKEILSSFSKPIKTETGTLQVSTIEMTACDLVRYIDDAGQINNVATILSELLPEINIEILVNYLEKGYIELTIAQRLGFLLEHLDPTVNLTGLAQCVAQKKPRYRLLVSGSNEEIFEKNKKWRININEIIETDL